MQTVRIDRRNEREAQKRKDKRRNYILGEYITERFPKMSRFEPGTKSENAVEFEEFIEWLPSVSNRWQQDGIAGYF